MTPVQAIRRKCLDCCCGHKNAVKECDIRDCSLHPYRLGHNPFLAPRRVSEEQKRANAERLAVYRKSLDKTKENGE